jgi:hypothetical protein
VHLSRPAHHQAGSSSLELGENKALEDRRDNTMPKCIDLLRRSIFKTAETFENKGFLPFSYACLSLVCRLNPQADTKR